MALTFLKLWVVTDKISNTEHFKQPFILIILWLSLIRKLILHNGRRYIYGVLKEHIFFQVIEKSSSIFFLKFVSFFVVND